MKMGCLTIPAVLVQLVLNCSSFANYEQAKLSASDANTDDRLGISVAIDGSVAVVGAYLNDSNGLDSGAAYVYELSGSDWFEKQKLTPSDIAAGDNFGRSVAVEGNTIVVGSYLDNNTGSAYVFTKIGSTWSQQQKLTASAPAYGDKFGFSLSIDNNTIVVGNYGDDAEAGSVYVFTKINSTWFQQQKLTASDATAGDRFGYSVAIDNNAVIAGAHWDDHSGYIDAGSAYVFGYNGQSWIQDAVLRASDPNSYNYFGCSVALDGNCAAIGAYECDIIGAQDAGAAYVFERTDTGWIQQQKIINAVNPNNGDDFGRAVAVKSDTVIVGCPNYYLDDIPTGNVFGFIRSDDSWVQHKLFTADDADANDSLGFSVAVSGPYLVAGAPYDDDAGVNSGSAYVFVDSSGDITGDGSVDFKDFALLAAAWRTAPDQPSYNPACDLSIPPDMLIDLLDLGILCDDWLTGK